MDASVDNIVLTEQQQKIKYNSDILSSKGINRNIIKYYYTNWYLKNTKG